MDTAPGLAGASPPPSRRRFLKRIGRGALGLGALGLGIYTWRVEPHWIDVTCLDLPIERLPDSLVGKILVQISDLHIGPVVAEDYIRDAIARACDLEPDILAITGDFVTYRDPEQIEQMTRVLALALRPARLATVGVLGNHDYGTGWSNAGIADRLTGRLRDLGITLLRNQRCDVAGLEVVGVDDLWGPNFNPQASLAGSRAEAARLILCHNPDAVDGKVLRGQRGWVLSGHTHGGQCKPPFFGPPILPVRNGQYVRGAIDLGAGRHLYVNRGLGYNLRVRVNVRPEISVFTLRRAATT